MDTAPESYHRTILLFDIEKFGTRDDVEQAVVRRMLYAVVDEILTAAEIEPIDQYREDRGDSVMVLINPLASKARLLRALVTETPALLHAKNRLASSSTQIRLRIVVASGEVALHPVGSALGGAVGTDLNQAFRVLNDDQLRAALKAGANDSVLCISDAVYRGTASHGHGGIRGADFAPIEVHGKTGERQETAWLYGAVAATRPAPEAEEPSDKPAAEKAPAAAPERGGTVVNFHGGAPQFGGGQVNGDQTVVSGGTVHGDINLGGTTSDRRS